jgi:hypothetical protein
VFSIDRNLHPNWIDISGDGDISEALRNLFFRAPLYPQRSIVEPPMQTGYSFFRIGRW